MKLQTHKLTRSLASIVCFLLLGQSLPAAEEHPAMHDASEALHAAQSAANPIVKLEEAAGHLKRATANKQGYRVAALKHTENAIAALKAGKRIEADKAIEAALHEIEKGIALHPGDNKRR